MFVAVPDLPDRPLWIERLAARWVARRSPTAIVASAIAAIAAVGVLDAALTVGTGVDFVVTVLYVVPIAVAAWAAGLPAGVGGALLAAAAEAVATWWGARGAVQPWAVAVSVALELLVFMGAAFSFARLRWHLDRHRELSRTDALTGLANERAFQEAALHELARVDRRPAPLSVVYLDVDRFKELNDTRGHSAGNDFLRLVGGALRRAVRAADTAARLGGDEFALLLPEADAGACRQVVERVRERLAQESRAAGHANTFSVGAVTFEGAPPGYDALVAAADRAMYLVKNDTKDGVAYLVVPAAPQAPTAARRRATSGAGAA